MCYIHIIEFKDATSAEWWEKLRRKQPPTPVSFMEGNSRDSVSEFVLLMQTCNYCQHYIGESLTHAACLKLCELQRTCMKDGYLVGKPYACTH